jgi:hypothetical protein
MSRTKTNGRLVCALLSPPTHHSAQQLPADNSDCAKESDLSRRCVDPLTSGHRKTTESQREFALEEGGYQQTAGD